MCGPAGCKGDCGPDCPHAVMKKKQGYRIKTLARICEHCRHRQYEHCKLGDFKVIPSGTCNHWDLE